MPNCSTDTYCFVFGYVSVFLSSDNLANVLTQIITTALLGFGMTYVIISGEIDLSIAPTLAMSSVIVATLLSKGYPMIIAAWVV